MRTTADWRLRPAGPRAATGRRRGLAHIPAPYVLATLLAASLVLAVLSLRAFFAPMRFPVRVVRVVGDLQNVPRPALVNAVAPFLQKNFYGLDLNSVERAVRQVPWVGAAHVERRFPRTLVIYVAPQVLAAQWAQGGWVGARGSHVHLQGYHLPQGLPVFRGPAGREAYMVTHYRRFQELLSPLGLDISTLTLSERQTWRINLSKGPLLVLGHDGSARIARFVRVFPQIATRFASMRRVDLRYTNGFAVSWRGASGDQHDKKG